jgi:Protein of unknown function (DUF1592)/Protein of unknown function (DUF1588)/Protein of unknown function (DUF1585)/Protein of unknown function (DUF1587)/Protein of unknown function (DUF1595)/Planctomycete cytochrome C
LRTTVRATLVFVSVGGAAVAGMLLLARHDGGSESVPEVLDEYCVVCHNEIDWAGNLRLDDKDPGNVASEAEAWEHVVRKVKTGMMPPAGEPRPARATLDSLVAELETRLDRAGDRDYRGRRAALRRLNRTEYANAVRDLLHLEVDAATLLPLDDSSEGFDNIATALGVSPTLVEAYVSAAMRISRSALGDPTTTRTQVAYAAPERLPQDRRLAGLPLGTRGGLSIEHWFPLDAAYEFRIRRGFRSPGSARVDVTLDGAPVAAEDPTKFRLPVTAGPHTLTVALVDTRRPMGVHDIYAEYEIGGGIQSIEIDGPFEASGVGGTPSRRRILICEPASAANETPCAEDILSTLATRAFRRPISREDLASLMTFFEAGREEGGFEGGLQHALARVLVDPRFLYRIERDPPEIEAGAQYDVGDFELASRLSFFLWSSIPDDALLATAAGGRLREPDVLESEVRRMLADPKADALIDNFAAQWVFLRELDSVTPDDERFDEALRRAMVEETRNLFAAVIRDDLSVLRLLDADFTFVDERLAEHYEIPGVHGSHFRRIEIPPDSPRRGLLGHASILTLTSVTSRTSPVIRGNWILETLLGSPAPLPPPNVETTLEGDADGVVTESSVRERLEAHRQNPTCASCHAIMDPIGFALENFDLIGAWRDTDGGRPVDASATLADGTAVSGPADLRAALLGRSEAFATTLTKKLLTYALGRGLEHYDMPTVRAIVRAAEAEDYRFSALVLGVAQSVPFRTQIKGAGD